jgi:hypothetical protein
MKRFRKPRNKKIRLELIMNWIQNFEVDKPTSKAIQVQNMPGFIRYYVWNRNELKFSISEHGFICAICFQDWMAKYRQY